MASIVVLLDKSWYRNKGSDGFTGKRHKNDVKPYIGLMLVLLDKNWYGNQGSEGPTGKRKKNWCQTINWSDACFIR